MSSSETTERRAEVRARNVGGIDETRVTLEPGVTVLTGRNATNRTSFLRAIMAAVGSDDVSLKGDADEGEVTLVIDGEVYTRRFVRKDGIVTTGGDPYLEDPSLADLFAFLLEHNEARRTVERGGDLRDVVMRPVDTDAIREEVDRLQRERDRVDEELEEIGGLADRAPKLESERTRLDAEIEEKRAELEDGRAELEDADGDVAETREEKAELDDRLEELQDLRSAREDVRFRLESTRESVEALREERAELEAELADLPSPESGGARDFESEIRRLRDRKQSLESTISDLRRLVQFNEDQLRGEGGAALEGMESTDESVTDRLLDADRVVCWTCGSEVDREAIESTLDTLRELSQEKREERDRVESDLEELRAERDELEARRERRENLEGRLRELDADLDGRSERIEDLRARESDLDDEIDAAEAEIEQLQQRDYGEVLDVHREVNQLEFELDRLEDEREDVTSELASIEDRLEDRADLEERRAAIEDDLADLRTRVERLENEVIDEFNERMESVLSLLEYENVERVWIERRREEVREGRRTVETSTFDLHVIRRTDDGTTYEDALDHLSESEREVTGLVFALAGYLVHDVHEVVPFVLLDSLEAIDSERIAALVEYLSEFGEYLVVALLPEDSRSISEDHPRVTEI